LDSINIIAKVTRNCNLRCYYCNELNNIDSIMPFSIVADLISKSLRHPNMKSVKFVWHGGEPLLSGINFYKKILFLQNKCKNNSQKVKNVIQTNGTLLDDSWANFLRAGHFSIGLSLDGPRKLHNIHRFDAKGKGSFDDVLCGMDILNSYNIKYGVLIVITENTLRFDPQEMFDFFLDNNIKDFSFLHRRPRSEPNRSYNSNSDYVNLLKFNSYLIDIFDLWFEHDDPSIHIREFENIIEILLGGKPHICSLTGNCFGKFLGININGDVYHCDRFVSDRDYELGNIIRDPFEAIIDPKKIEYLLSLHQKVNSECKRCEFFSICRGGCPHDAYINFRSIDKYSNKSCGNGLLIKHIREKIGTS
jgi:uncharacterized protein